MSSVPAVSMLRIDGRDLSRPDVGSAQMVVGARYISPSSRERL